MMQSLRDRLAALRDQHKRSAPSFTPGPRQTKTKVVEVLPDVAELVPVTELENIRELAALHLKHGSTERRGKKAKEPVTESLKALCNDYGLTKARCPESNARITYYPMSRESVNPQLLLNEGVAPDIIKRCTVKTDSFAVRVSYLDKEEVEEDLEEGDDEL